MTKTSQFDFVSGQDPDPAYQWDTICKRFNLAEVCTLPSTVPVLILSLSSLRLTSLVSLCTFILNTESRLMEDLEH